ncbi:nitrite reductase, copper-containing [Halorientalis sp. IM1011]|uniref:copper-containing nitrite reductase n=1 Tax=Halorientalis sp. IM1011 TaxID=1932360 RepID=UPI00097CD40F|nr:copper-containing nitrite reductase [Halorientalis sp. IM1011]AQL44005.1 nitrite reductase, copper-containing [Halorientalis sp. IM1011]
MFDSTRRKWLQALGISGAAATIAGCTGNEAPAVTETANNSTTTQSDGPAETDVDRVAADPTDLPDPVDWSSPKTHEVTLTVEEVTAEIEPGVTFDYMTFDGQVPGPMVRVRQGDTVEFTMENAPESGMVHNVDFHAVYGTGGGAVATTANPGSENSMRFRAEYPGAFIYHCAVPNLDYHISAGMFGMILVEPEQGLPEVDRELYLGQHELYTDKDTGEEGHHKFDFEAMADESPTYVLLNGEKHAWAAGRYGPVEVQQDERVRVFMVDGGPNVSSNFHPIGNVWSEAYRDGGIPEDGDLSAYADKNIQTMKVPPGSCMIGEMDTPVPSRIKLVDHALSRVARKGLLAEVDVVGNEDEGIYDPDAMGTSHEDPLYE